MPRKPRFYVPGMPAHVVQRGNNRQPCFFDDNDYLTYLDWLRESADKAGCQIHAYVLMTNHVHLLATPGDNGEHRQDAAEPWTVLRPVCQSHLRQDGHHVGGAAQG